MVTWNIFNIHLFKVGLTQNQETIALWMLATVDLFYFIMCEDRVWTVCELASYSYEAHSQWPLYGYNVVWSNVWEEPAGS